MLRVVAVAVAVASAVTGLAVRTSHSGLDLSSIEFQPSEIDLGNVECGRTVEGNVRLRNRTSHSIRKLTAGTDCECLRPRGLPDTLRGNSEVRIGFGLDVGKTPGAISRVIKVFSEQRPDVQWEVRVRARAVARVWTSPESLAIVLGDDGRGRARLTYHFEDGFVPVQILCPDGSVSIEHVYDGEAVRVCEVLVHSDSVGESRIQALDARGEPLCETQLCWLRRPNVTFVPRVLYLSDRQLPEQVDVYIVAAQGAPIDELQFEQLVEWISAIEARTIDEHRIRVRIALNVVQVPAVVNTAILRVQVDGTDQGHELWARRDSK